MSYSVRLEQVEMVDEATQADKRASDLYGHIVEAVRQFTSDRPFFALGAAMGIGLATGLLIPRQ